MRYKFNANRNTSIDTDYIVESVGRRAVDTKNGWEKPRIRYTIIFYPKVTEYIYTDLFGYNIHNAEEGARPAIGFGGSK